MSDWLTARSPRYATMGTAANTLGGTIVTGASAHTKGAFATFLGNTPFDADGLYLHVQNPQTNLRNYLLDIGIGTNGSIAIPNLLFYRFFGSHMESYFVPLELPANTPLQARVQGPAANDTLSLSATLVSASYGGRRPLGAVHAYGAVSDGATRGTTLTSGLNVKGAWGQLTASTVAPMTALLIVCGSSNTDSNGLGFSLQLDIGVGPAGSERTLVGDLRVEIAWGTFCPGVLGPFMVSVPQGQRLAARCQRNANFAPEQSLDVVVYGLH